MMKAKTSITVALLVFVLASITYALVTGPFARSGAPDSGSSSAGSTVTTAGPERPSAATTETDSSQSPHKVVAYYFHGTKRCVTCRKIEALAYTAIHEGFGDAIDSGRLQWQVVNVETRKNRHFIKDYKLYTKSIVLVDIRDGSQQRWKNLEKVWELVHNEDAYLAYINSEVASFLDHG